MLYLLDTNTVAFLLNGRSPAARQKMREAQEHGTVAVSAVTHGEILFGLEKRPEALRLRAAMESFFDAVEILPWDATVAPAYGRLRASLEAAGKTLAGLDMLIAAHALARDATLVTHDQAFFRAGSLLRAVDWATDL